MEKRTWRYPLDEGMRELNCDIIQGEHAVKRLDEELALRLRVLSAQLCTQGEKTHDQIGRQ